MTIGDVTSKDPRRVGGTYWNDYRGVTYLVCEIDHEDGDVTVLDLDGPTPGTVRTHRTAWARRDRVVSVPAAR
jgi:hypothetical protein